MTVRHFLDVDDLSPEELTKVLDLAELVEPPAVLAGLGVALLFEKPSLRTRNATEMAIVQLGGHPLSLRGDEVGLSAREPARDVVRVLGGYHAAVAARVFDHGALEEMVAFSDVPVINLLSDEAHPCQALADLLTLRQHYGRLEGLRVAYVGDFNNVARSLGVACAMSGASYTLGCPPDFAPTEADIDHIAALGGCIEVSHRPHDAVDGADAVYTDVWTSMGQEAEATLRQRAFDGFVIDASVMAAAGEKAVFLHCLPAHRGEEVTDDVVESDRSLVWHQAHNRMHAVRGLFLWMFEGRR